MIGVDPKYKHVLVIGMLMVAAAFLGSAAWQDSRPGGDDAAPCRVDTAAIVAPYKLALVSVGRPDTVFRVPDSIAKKLFLASYKLERVRKYLKICLRNPSQDKFLKGWIKRAIN